MNYGTMMKQLVDKNVMFDDDFSPIERQMSSPKPKKILLSTPVKEKQEQKSCHNSGDIERNGRKI